MPKQKLVLIQDSREQAPLKFKKGVFDNVVIKALPVGDYGLVVEPLSEPFPLIFERKSLGDLFGTLSNKKSIECFKRELARAKERNIILVLLIEASMKAVSEGYKYSLVGGDSLLKTVFTLWVKYGLVPVFCENRRTAARFVEESFTALARNWGKK